MRIIKIISCWLDYHLLWSAGVTQQKINHCCAYPTSNALYRTNIQENTAIYSKMLFLGVINGNILLAFSLFGRTSCFNPKWWIQRSLLWSCSSVNVNFFTVLKKMSVLHFGKARNQNQFRYFRYFVMDQISSHLKISSLWNGNKVYFYWKRWLL